MKKDLDPSLHELVGVAPDLLRLTVNKDDSDVGRAFVERHLPRIWIGVRVLCPCEDHPRLASMPVMPVVQQILRRFSGVIVNADFPSEVRFPRGHDFLVIADVRLVASLCPHHVESQDLPPLCCCFRFYR